MGSEWTLEFEGEDLGTVGKLGAFVARVAKARDYDTARRFVDHYIHAQTEHQGGGIGLARNLVRNNIGYLSGYYDLETMRLIQEVFDVSHPIFGTRTDVTPDEALAAGKALATGSSAAEGES